MYGPQVLPIGQISCECLKVETKLCAIKIVIWFSRSENETWAVFILVRQQRQVSSKSNVTEVSPGVLFLSLSFL